jgi:uncharacterized LabA/DUF88 family protein
METIAAFIDAAYLLAAGGQAVATGRPKRADIVLDEKVVVAEIMDFANACEPNSRFLRMYWYDGLGGGKETPEQRKMAEAAHVKVRFGIINSSGEQKGVDSLIVTDLVELSRQNAISAAILVAGDEDLRIGVEIAQRYGVKVHLLGIVPSRGNQSPLLRREVDTLAEWDAERVSRFLRVLPPPPPDAFTPNGEAHGDTSEAPEGNADLVDHDWSRIADPIAAQLSKAQADLILEQWHLGNGVAPTYDRRLLGAAGADIAPLLLGPADKRALREAFMHALEAQVTATDPPE